MNTVTVMALNHMAIFMGDAFSEKAGMYANMNGARYRNLANLNEVNAVFHIFALAMVAPANAAIQTGGVMLES